MSFARKCLLGCTAFLASAALGLAGSIPYSNIGTQNPVTYTFTATATGDITAYFYSHSGAVYTDTLGLEVNGVPTGITGLANQTSFVGEALDLGKVTAGDTLTFFVHVQNTGVTFYSNPALNYDGANHVYSTSFAGNSLVPAGTYIGLEDLAASGSDFNYADEQFVFTDTTPEPASFGLIGLALVGAALAKRRLR